jgi:hypothetical protein
MTVSIDRFASPEKERDDLRGFSPWHCRWVY